MHNLENVLFLMVNIIWLSLFATKIKTPLPILLLIGGLAVGFFSDQALVTINPQVVFLIFLPPLLFQAAHNVSWHEFKEWRLQIFFLAIGLVFFTAGCVAVTAHYLIPGFSWELGFLLGAIVAPPDAVAASTTTKNLALPVKIVTILEGESLVNDASSLTMYQYALLAIASGSFNLTSATLSFALVSFGGVALGLVLGLIVIFLLRQIIDSTLTTIISLIVPLITYILAERLHLSGVIAVVSCALLASWYTSEVLSFQTRFRMKEFWEVLIFLMNGLIFLLIGLQLPAVVSSFSPSGVWHLVLDGILISGVVIFARLLWVVFFGGLGLRIRAKLHPDKLTFGPYIYKHLMVVSWAGMRGVVSLAAAMAIPILMADGTRFPLRNEILLITFVVILVTLILHGLTLPLIIKKLGVTLSREKIDHEEKMLRDELLIITLAFIDNQLSGRYPAEVVDELKRKIKHEVTFRQNKKKQQDSTYHQILVASMEIIKHQRKALNDIHRENRYETNLIRRIEEDFDILNLSIHNRMGGYDDGGVS